MRRVNVIKLNINVIRKESKCLEHDTTSSNSQKGTFAEKFRAPTMYKPLVLSVALLGLGSCAGDTYISKFMIQILSSAEALGTVDTSGANNSNRTAGVNLCVEKDFQVYVFPLIIQVVKMLVILLMGFLLRKFRVRFLYFLSLASTGLLLVCLGFICDETFATSIFSILTIRYIKTILLCFHIVCIQFWSPNTP